MARMHLHIQSLEITASIGVYDWEKRAPRPLLAHISIAYDASAAVASDDINDALDYAHIAARVAETAKARHYNLLETLVQAVGRAVLEIPRVAEVEVEITKPGALPGAAMVSAKGMFVA